MGFWIVILLGIIQGATEFLPVSSSGHLVLFYNIFGITDGTILFSVLLHVATLLAVIYVYWKDIIQLIKHPFCKTNRLLASATIPTVILALLLKGTIEDSFGGGSLIVCFFITGFVLMLSDYFSKKQFVKKNAVVLGITNQPVFVKKEASASVTEMNISYKQAVAVGVCQGLACFPGISRSGSTIASGLIVGIDKKDATDFSFLLSIPIILASLLLEVIDYIKVPTSMPFSTTGIILGCIAAFISGLLCIKLLLRIVKKQKLIWFSLYLFALGTFLLLNKYLLLWF